MVIFSVSVSNRVSAKILWSKDLVDANTNSVPLASCLNKDANGIIVMTRECPKGKLPALGGNVVLWEIGIDGSVTRTLPKDANGNKIWTNSNPAGIGSGCAIVSNNSSNLLTVGVLNEQRDKDEQKVAIVLKTDKTEKTISIRNSIESHSIKKMILLQDNTFALVGDRKSDGLFLRIDGQGKIMQEKLFNKGQADKFSDVDQIKPDNSNLAVVGVSLKISVKDPNENSAENFILIYDPNLNLAHEDDFTGGLPGLLLPKVCCLDNGNIVVFYKKNSEYSKTILWARCYTKELRFLWEREIFASDKMPFFLDIVSYGDSDFVAWIGQEENLDFYLLDNNGTKIDNIQYKSLPGGAFGVEGFNLLRINDRTIAIFGEGTAGNLKECSIKAKVIALD